MYAIGISLFFYAQSRYLVSPKKLDEKSTQLCMSFQPEIVSTIEQVEQEETEEVKEVEKPVVEEEPVVEEKPVIEEEPIVEPEVIKEPIEEKKPELKEEVMKLNEKETILFLERAIQIGMRPKRIDCSKALIFISGNLDEAYNMNKIYNPDICADKFYEESLKITVSDIREALKYRFRNDCFRNAE